MKRKKSKARRPRKSKRRSNPARRRARASKRRSNPVRRRRSNPSRRRRRSNPGLSLKSAMNKNFLISTLATAAGFVVGIKGTKYLLMIPGLAGKNRFIGVLHLVLGGLVAVKAKNPKAKAVGAGLAAAGAFDLIAKNVTALRLPTLLGMDSDVAGDMMGETYLPGQTQILGEEYAGETYTPGNTQILGEEYAGNDVYADV